jgi:PKD domain/Bacterial Ig-like domain/Galactose oxidase, central domain
VPFGSLNRPAVLLALGVAVQLAGGSAALASSYSPMPTGSMSVARDGHTATLLADGNVLAVGGTDDTATELYNPSSGTWMPSGALADPRRSGHTATLLPDGRVLVAGGDGRGAAELYNPATGTWTPTGSMIEWRAYHTATLLGDGTVLVTGGVEDLGAVPVATAEIYNPTTGLWTQADRMADDRWRHTATRLADGRVLVAGGCTWLCRGVKSSSELYDPVTGQWTSAGALGRHRAWHTATLLPTGEVLVAGGHGGGVIQEVFDPAPQTWSPTNPSTLYRRFGMASSLVPDGRVLATGGGSDTTELYTHSDRTWAAAGPMGVRRSGHTQTLLSGGTVLVAGGVSCCQGTATAEVFFEHPETTISSGTTGTVRSRSARFEFHSDEEGVTFECRLDTGAWTECESPKVYSDLPEGEHTFGVRAVDASGTADPNEATRTFTVDLTPPAVTLDTPAAGTVTNDQTPRFAGAAGSATGDEGVTLKLYAGATTADPLVQTLAAVRSGGRWRVEDTSPLADGTYTARAEQRDAGGNVGYSASRVIAIDATPPETSIGGGPPAVTTSRAASFVVSSSEEGSSFECRLDGGDWVACPSPQTYEDLSEGEHVLSTRATDAPGNTDASPASQAWRVDLTPPTAALSVAPNPILSGETVTLDASASADPGGAIARYEWDLDGDGSFETDTGADPRVARAYATAGEFVPQVRVIDASGLSNGASARLEVTPASPPGPVGVSINAGARFTHDPDVTLTVAWPAFAARLSISNDGGFGSGRTVPVAPRVPWTLRSPGSDRLPETVYVRFAGTGVDGNQTFTDDIILDEARPVVLSATLIRLRGPVYRVRVRARDRISGVSRLQVARNRARPGKVRRYRRSMKIRSRSSRLWIRVHDRAGNKSRWRRAELR